MRKGAVKELIHAFGTTPHGSADCSTLRRGEGTRSSESFAVEMT